MTMTYVKRNETGTLLFEGDLTVRSAAELRTALMKALLDADSVAVAYGDVAAADLTLLQLLCAARRSAARLNKLFTVGEAPAAVAAVAETTAMICKDCDAGSCACRRNRAAGA